MRGTMALRIGFVAPFSWLSLTFPHRSILELHRAPAWLVERGAQSVWDDPKSLVSFLT
jgi:hypothetical protein